MINNKHSQVSLFLPSVGIMLAAFLLSFAVRAYHIEDIHYKFDEWLGTLQAGPPVSLADGIFPAVQQIHMTSQYYIMSTLTVTTCVIMQLLKLITGPDLAAMRWWFIAAASLGVAVTGWIAARLFRPWSAPAISVILMGAFSVCGIIFSQFANNFAFTYLITAIQLGLYLCLVRKSWSWPGFLLFAVTAYFCQLVMYTQLLVTAGLFLAALVEITAYSRRVRNYSAWIFGGVVYGALGFLHFFYMFSRLPWDEPFRIYMAPYYPLAVLGKAGLLNAWDTSWFGYYLLRLYDLFNYHWSLVFNPEIYQPLQWNLVSVPFMAVLLLGLIGGIFKRHGESEAPVPGVLVIPLIFFSILLVHMLANGILMITFGGTRQCVYLAPLFWLFYGWLISNILNLFRGGRKIFYRLTVLVLVILPVLPFALSLPGLYHDRIGRIDLDLIAESIECYQPEEIISPRDSIQGIQLTMMNDPRFTDVHWPGYPYESDMLDADPVQDPVVLSFTINGKEHLIHLVSPESFPKDGENVLYLDLYMSYDGRFEDGQLKQFYIPIKNIISRDQRIIPLAEKPGNAPKAIHQSIYWPPNSFYLYRVIKE